MLSVWVYLCTPIQPFLRKFSPNNTVVMAKDCYKLPVRLTSFLKNVLCLALLQKYFLNSILLSRVCFAGAFPKRRVSGSLLDSRCWKQIILGIINRIYLIWLLAVIAWLGPVLVLLIKDVRLPLLDALVNYIFISDAFFHLCGSLLFFLYGLEWPVFSTGGVGRSCTAQWDYSLLLTDHLVLHCHLAVVFLLSCMRVKYAPVVCYRAAFIDAF